MKKSRSFVTFLAVLALSACLSVSARAEPVMEVVAIDAGDHASEYLSKVGATLDLLTAAAPGSSAKVWRAQYSGNTTGLIYVAIEYPSLAAFAAAQDAIANDDEFQDSIKALEETGRIIVSRSLLNEVAQ